MAGRRDALKIIGAIGTTCAFPFASDELYGQHVHPPAGVPQSYGPPKFFSAEEMTALARLSDLIIPRTATPGAIDAGVPAYIDYVVSTNEDWRTLFREGLTWVRGHQDSHYEGLLDKYIDQPGDDAHTSFIRALKSMTADGYYTSQAGLTQDLGFQGGSVLERYPVCEVPEH